MTTFVMDISPFQFLADIDGQPLDEGYVWIGDVNKDPRQFPASVFYDAALTIPAAMPLRTTNGFVTRNGSPAFLYVNGNYSVLVENKQHVQIYYVADFFLTGTSGAVSVSDLANATDPLKGAGLVGYRNRTVYARLSDFLNVKDFGAVGDGVTDDTAAFNAAIAYANSRGGIDFLNIVGTTIFIPDGRYKIGALSPIVKSGCEFVGGSRDGAVLLLTSNVKTFTFGDGVNIIVGGGVSNVKLEYLSLPSASSFCFSCRLAYRMKFSNILVARIGVLCELGTSSSSPAGGIIFSGIDGSKENVACPLFAVNYGAGLFLNDVHVFIPVPVPVHPNPMTTVPGCSVFNCFVGFWDTIQASECIFERFDQGLSMTAASSMVYQNMYFSNVIMDYFRRWCVYAESQSGGVIAGIRFDNTSWFVSWETSTINLLGAGYNDNHEFMGKVVIAGGSGVDYTLANAKNITFNGMQINSVNRLGITSGAMNIAANSTGFSILGCKGNVDTTGLGFPWRAAFGIVIGTNCDSFIVEGNIFEGSTAGYSVAANASPSVNRRMANNGRANYAGQAAGMTLGASTVAFFNNTPFVVQCSLRQGTVSSILKGAIGINGAVDGDFMVDPGQSLTVTYTVAPSLTALTMA